MKLKMKTMVTILVPILLALSLVIGYSSYTLYTSQKQSARTNAEAISQRYSSRIEAEFEVANDAAKTIADIASGFEPNAFDGKDQEYMGTEGHDSAGRFIPYWDRFDGDIQRHYLENYTESGEGDYYLSSFELGREFVLEPLEYTLDGHN